MDAHERLLEMNFRDQGDDRSMRMLNAEDLPAEHTPPVIHYRLGEEHQGFYVEFLVPLHGRGVRRDGTPDATILKAGITAQKLGHLDLLLAHPWQIRLGSKEDVPLKQRAWVSTANPVSFVAQKILIYGRRAADKRAQDALYVHDTLELFGHELERLQAVWVEQVRPTLPSRTAGEVRRLARRQFGVVTDVIREASRIPQDRQLNPDTFQQACAYGLEKILSGE